MMVDRIVVGALLLLTLVVAAPGRAGVSGPCANCHTMHNSQDGVTMAFSRDPDGTLRAETTPYNRLLKTDCVGCHTNTSNATIANLGPETRVPIVYNTMEPTYPPDGSSASALAGGNFYWVANLGDEYGHNVHGISSSDSRLSTAPGAPAGVGGCSTSDCHGSLDTQYSGCLGCHVPQHHARGSAVVAGMEEGWYRFLGSTMLSRLGDNPPSSGVKGISDPNWEQNPAAGRHNTYQGAIGPYNGTDFMHTGSINQKCVGCHGEFHENMAAGGVWLYHPNDVVIPNSGEFAAYTTYNPLVPVSRQSVSAADQNFTEINLGSDVVSCISCHRAHGSPYPAMLRWGYRDWPGTDSHTGGPAFNGCAVCHTHKD
ncbi:cytochrome c3 family protein [Desulfurivibrio sp. D14AmB]|uniref:cytochrome c3 family protein n=1 Tax=Desulfurivibrio sp. D14AmB TaxID=3374370 RepID=UPI00376F37ED